MAVNHVIANGETLIDLRDSTVTKSTLMDGTVAYDKSGNRIVGQMENIEPWLDSILGV